MKSNPPLKICIVSEQLSGGGAEKAAAVLSNFFEKNQCIVYHVIVVDNVSYSFSGQLFNMGLLKNKSNSVWNKIQRFRHLNRFFKSHSFDFIIDNRVKNNFFQEFLITKLIYNAPVILVVHSFMINLYFPKNRFLAHRMYGKSFRIIAVSKEIQNRIESKFHFKNVQTLHNPIDFEEIEHKISLPLQVNYRFVLAVGRLIQVKQFEQLIAAYADSNLPQNQI